MTVGYPSRPGRLCPSWCSGRHDELGSFHFGERDRAILDAAAAGHPAEAIGRTFGVSRMSVSRVLARAADSSGRPA
jgi:hypothetical protein